MKHAIFSIVIVLLTSLVFHNAAFADNSPEAHAKDTQSGREIVGVVHFCGPQGTNGSVVELVGESFSAVLDASGVFRLRNVPRGDYTLRVRILGPGQPKHTQTVKVRGRRVTDVGDILICPDKDNDGFALDRDCDDGNSTINPNAIEICDGVDNNCDGSNDEGFDFNTDPNNCGACSNVCSGSCTGGICVAVCGNGVVEPGEQCDDGNNTDGDVCQADCTLPTGCTSDAECSAPNLCSTASCNVATGACVNTPVVAGTSCGSPTSNACNGPDSCDGAGTCETYLASAGTVCGPGSACNDRGSCISADNDRDGFDSSVDCNDSNSSVNPNASEICNGTDDNCNGITDEGVCNGLGTFKIQPAVTYSCSHNSSNVSIFDFNVQTFSFKSLTSSSIQVTGAPSGPTMSGSIDSTGSFQVEFHTGGGFINTGIGQNHRLTGQFSDPDHWTGTLLLGFPGLGALHTDCSGGGWTVTGTR